MGRYGIYLVIINKQTGWIKVEMGGIERGLAAGRTTES